MPKLKFFDVRKRKSFTTDKYELTSKKNPKTKRMVYMAKTKSKEGNKCVRFISKDFYMNNKK